jgi:U4/U6.U5 tri-snRNP component SNU23
VVKSTLNDVRLKIAELREKYDFAARIKEIKQAEVKSKEEAREAKRRKKEEERKAANPDAPVDQDMMVAMGFGGFGSSKR